MSDERLTIDVYKGRNSPTTITVFMNGSPIDFAALGATKVAVVIEGVEYGSDEGYVQYAQGGGKVTFTLGSVPNPPKRKSYGRLVYYSAANPKGRPIFTEETEYRLKFNFL